MLPMPPAIVDTPPVQAITPHRAAAAAPKPSLFSLVAQKMSTQGRPIFERYVNQTLLPQVRADLQAERAYRQQLQALVSAPTLDLAATTALIDARKQAEAASATTIRTAAFAMLRTLPAADRKLALTAIFTGARFPAPTANASTPAKAPKTP